MKTPGSCQTWHCNVTWYHARCHNITWCHTIVCNAQITTLITNYVVTSGLMSCDVAMSGLTSNVMTHERMYRAQPTWNSEITFFNLETSTFDIVPIYRLPWLFNVNSLTFPALGTVICIQMKQFGINASPPHSPGSYRKSIHSVKRKEYLSNPIEHLSNPRYPVPIPNFGSVH